MSDEYKEGDLGKDGIKKWIQLGYNDENIPYEDQLRILEFDIKAEDFKNMTEEDKELYRIAKDKEEYNLFSFIRSKMEDFGKNILDNFPAVIITYLDEEREIKVSYTVEDVNNSYLHYTRGDYYGPEYKIPSDLTNVIRINVFYKFYITEETLFSKSLFRRMLSEISGPGKVILIGNMENKFRNLDMRNIDVSDWDVSRVTSMEYMFDGCVNINKDFSRWDVSNVESMRGMFNGCRDFNAELSGWGNKLGKVRNMSKMFGLCSIFEGIGLENWDVSSVNDMEGMFNDCKNFNADLSFWGDKLGKVEDMSGMFGLCSIFEGKGLENWNVSNVRYMQYMFEYCKVFNPDLSYWGNKLSKVRSMMRMFFRCSSFQGKGLEQWDVSNVGNMAGMFLGCENFNADLSFWGDKLKDKDISSIFFDCIRFEGKGLENWDFSEVKSTINMFSGCKNIVYNGESDYSDDEESDYSDDEDSDDY